LDVLVGYVTDVLATCFTSSWDVEIVTDRTASITTTRTSPRKPIPAGLKVRTDELVGHLSASEALLAQGPPGWKDFVVPPDTRVQWAEDPRTRILTMSNPYVTLTVEIEPVAFGAVSGSGMLGELAGLSAEDSNKRHMLFSFVMQLEASFERLRSGHPDMPRYTRWVELEQEHALFRALDVWHQRERPSGRVGPSPFSD
jgi:hypothetical protein